MTARSLLRLLAPTFVVCIFWLGFGSAWMTLLAYHALIVLGSWRRIPIALQGRRRGRVTAAALLAGIAAGPLLYVLLPHITRSSAPDWLAAHGLAGASFLTMMPYFGLVHPILEQTHWQDLRNRTPLAHGFFAGYHVLVLLTLMSFVWLAIVFALLVAASVVWERVARRNGGAFVPCCMHMAADTGIILAVWMRVRAM